ncbi:MAG: isochorismate synthase [Candidatus Paceibacteria bacterium]|jgi:isochorismate synthase
MLSTDLLQKINMHWKQELPFVLYVLPEDQTAHLLLQEDASLHSAAGLDTPGFVFAPFDSNSTSFCIPEVVSKRICVQAPLPTILNEAPALYLETISDKEKHLLFVSEILQKIKNKEVTKVVASRKKEVLLASFNLDELVSRIIAMDVTAFRYVWYHPKTGIWCGATPEVLFLSDGASFSTMALAGTQRVNGDILPIWGAKETFEQQLVTDSITKTLTSLSTDIKVGTPKTHKAGSLYHIKTQIEGVFKPGETTLPKIASLLHPTPAVCGTPRKKAFDIIQKYEGYDREFYTGYLGAIEQKKDTAQLFVNLRCMKITPTTATIYIGGGITSGSIPEDEWQETKNKMATMLGVLTPMLS